MTTKTSKGRITGLLALTVEAQEGLEIGDPVHLTGNYEVEKSDGTKEILGHVSVANKGRVNTVMGTSVGNAVIPGDVTVEARGLEVREVTAGAAIASGALVGYDGTSYVAYTGVPGTVGNSATVALVGVALMAAAADGDLIDILVR